MSTKQCGTCKWWDKKNSFGLGNGKRARCSAPIPNSAFDSRTHSSMHETEGQDCPAYEERKEND